jgi:hypothetical protein
LQGAFITMKQAAPHFARPPLSILNTGDYRIGG